MSRNSKAEVLSSRYRTKRIDQVGLLSSHHTRPLDLLKGVRAEAARVYRSVINGKLPSSEGTRLVFILREIRCAIEAEIAQAAIIAAAIPPQPTRVTFSIVSVPTNHFVTAEMAQRLSRGEPLLPMIEQNPVEGIEEAQEPQELQALQEAPTDEPALAHEHAPIEADAPDANGFRRETHATIEAPAIVAESDRGAVAIEMASFRRRKKWPNPDDPSSFLR